MASFSYLYTNDVRIATLQEKITWVANAYITETVPNSSVDKSASNNFATVAYYFGLTKESNLTKAAADGNADLVILNFIKKFQYPNPRTPESLQNEISSGEQFAPLREIVKVLVQFYTLGIDSYLTLEEIRLFLFYNAAIAKRENYNLIELCNQIVQYRTDGILPETVTVPNPNDEFWKHETRQIRELMGILKRVNCIKEIDNGFHLDTKSLTYQLKGLLFDIVTYDSFWKGSDRKSYAEYLDISEEEISHFDKNLIASKCITSIDSHSGFSKFISAIRTKPFLLLAGISGSGKSRIVRELARACWPLDSDERKAKKPENYELIQVKPNWHDSSELIGYVSHIDGEKYVYGKFLPFVAKAWANRDKPYFLCLDEMNLAPVEQYFAEYLSVIETRKLVDGVIVTDPILESPKKKGDKSEELMRIPDLNGNGGWFDNFILELTYDNQELHDKFLNEGIALPPNLVVVGTVNMDETTFTFSRKVLDRAMTIEMNDVDLRGGLTESQEDSMVLDANQVIGDAAEGKDVYADNKAVCDKVIEYLETINAELEGTPFKIGYRARNEFLLYALNRILLTQTDGSEEAQTSVLNKALDEMTSMKILSRIEGEDQRIRNKKGEALLPKLRKIITDRLSEWEKEEYKPISIAKLEEMEAKLANTGFTSFWS